MQGTLYRYPHPTEPTKFLYVGQGPKRDRDHRSGKSSFGRRFKRDFPGVELPQPIKEVVEVIDYLELNELETIWMFRFHTWRPAYSGGYNIVLPGSQDYESLGKIYGPINGQKAKESGQIQRLGKQDRMRRKGKAAVGYMGGISNVTSGHLSRIAALGGRAAGRLTTEKKTGIHGLSQEERTENARKGGAIQGALRGPILGRWAAESGLCARIASLGATASNHTRWHVARNINNPNCKLCQQAA
jgi:hypothetical protein